MLFLKGVVRLFCEENVDIEAGAAISDHLAVTAAQGLFVPLKPRGPYPPLPQEARVAIT